MNTRGMPFLDGINFRRQTTNARCSIAWLAPISRFVANKRAAVALEFGFVIGPLLFTILAIMQIGYTQFVAAYLDLASTKAGRAIMTGQVSPYAMKAATFTQTYVCPVLPSMIPCANVIVNVSVVLSANAPASTPTKYNNYLNAAKTGLGTPTSTNATFCPGGSGDLVLVELLYPTTAITAIFQTVTPSSQTYYLMSAATFKNEPYLGAQTYAGC
jgi:Flp pilus assembly protein TadG